MCRCACGESISEEDASTQRGVGRCGIGGILVYWLLRLSMGGGCNNEIAVVGDDDVGGGGIVMVFNNLAGGGGTSMRIFSFNPSESQMAAVPGNEYINSIC